MKWHRRQAMEARPTVGQVAAALGVHRHTVQNWIKRGWLRARYADGTVARIAYRQVKKALKDPRIARVVVRAMAKKRAAYQTTES